MVARIKAEPAVKYDFSTRDKRVAFMKELAVNTQTWKDPLPNFEWITHTEFCRHGFFMYTDWEMFTRSWGPKSGTPFPTGWKQNPQVTIYGRCFIIGSMGGYAFLPSTMYKRVEPDVNPYGWKGKLYIGKFRFCVHDMTRTNIGKCLNKYLCSKCGYEETLDSSG